MPSDRRQLNVRLDDDSFIRLFATNATTDTYNQQRLHMLPAAARLVTVTTAFRDERPAKEQLDKPLDDEQRDKAIKDGSFAHDTQFRIGARVIITKNDPDGRFVNGDTGVITNIKLPDNTSVRELPPFNPFGGDEPKIGVFSVLMDRTEMTWDVGVMSEMIIDAMDKPFCSLCGFPIRLGWAISIHRSQGMTVDKAYVDMATICYMPGESRHGLAYVACSRTKSLDGLKLANWNDAAVYCSPSIVPYV